MRVSAATPSGIAVLFLMFANSGFTTENVTLSVDGYGCEDKPRPENAGLPLSDASDEWFQIYEVAAGVYSIVEPYQIQETISHPIVGDERALLFDTGVGLLPLKPVVERITDLPVTVLNSHTHTDHVGGNWEFSTVLAVDSDYTRANMKGFDNERIGGDFVPEAFCKGPPDGADISAFYTKPWNADRYVSDGEVLDLGGRKLEILLVPGHTPDAVALLDSKNRLLFTGDTWYDASLWLFARETSLADYDASLSRLIKLERDVDFLLGAHNLARVAAGRLAQVQNALKEIVSGEHEGELDDFGRLSFTVDGVRILTSQPAIDGKQGDTSKGGSGLDTWPNED
jgi:glyoxylase-like metal-dependent hydrolase (beta-lactamase superfamily II)